VPIPAVTGCCGEDTRATCAARWLEDEVDEVTRPAALWTPGRPGGGWRALLADVLGEADTPLSALVATLSAPEQSTRWSEASLDEAWRCAHAADVARGPDRPTSSAASLSGVG
jgi:hypothetical protein